METKEKSTTFSTRLSEAIEARGVTQKWLAEKSFTTEATISRYVKQVNNPAVLTILADIARALEVSSDFLIGLTNIPDEKDTIADDAKILLSCYNRASKDDKKVLWALLSKYMTSSERERIDELF